MSEVMRLKRVFAFFVLFVCFNSLIANAGQLDKSRYIGIDEIKRGMKGYCLTVYEGTKIEKFELDVVDVVLDYRPGRNAIMVIGTDERFIHSGTVHGCSGSPVFIDGRLAGALAFGWDGAKDPLYGVTPIGEMLVAGEVVNYETMDKGGFGFDYSRPVDFGRAYKKILGGVRVSEPEFAGGMKKLSCPLFVSGLPEEVMGDFGRQMRGLGFEAIAGSGVGSKIEQGGEVKLERGSSLAVPLVTGDISMAVMGTVTEVVGDKVYGFGHSFMGYGAVNFPMATGTIHTVVSHLFGSFKFGSPLEVVGTLTADEATAVYGRVGVEPEMIELVIKVDRYNDSEVRVYNCQIANNEIYTPMILGAAVSGAGLMKGSLPPDNSVEYSVVIDVEGFEPIRYENISTIVGLGEMVSESSSAVAMLMSNPYRRLKIKRLEFDFRIEAKDIASRIWSVNVSDGSVKPGQQVDVTVVTEKYLGAKRKFEYRFKVPEDLKSGEYDLIVTGGRGYLDFLRQKAGARFVPDNINSLVGAIDEILGIGRDKLYCIFVLPPSGLWVERAELPDLPGTAAMVLADSKRTLRAQPWVGWKEKVFEVDGVVIDQKVLKIRVEEYGLLGIINKD